MHHAGHGSRRRSTPRRPLLGLGGALIALIVLNVLTAEVPAAATGAPASGRQPAHPWHDWMGSTVAAHEGRAATSGSAAGTAHTTTHVTQTPGFDASHWQGAINWGAAYAKGARFAYVKATEGSTYRDPDFNANYTDSYYAGYIRGAYHFAIPNSSGGATQAAWFVAHGGGWSRDGQTLPPMLDIEYNPYGAACYGLSQSAMRSWISAFVNAVHAETGRWATIYTTTEWWTTCTGKSTAYAARNPLFVARYGSSAGALPAGWPFYTFWQHADSGVFPGDQDYFNGPLSGLQHLADNT
jgi:GH25 family lysozyme M1 (1,4-beta-N-acetylmuramidase)